MTSLNTEGSVVLNMTFESLWGVNIEYFSLSSDFINEMINYLFLSSLTWFIYTLYFLIIHSSFFIHQLMIYSGVSKMCQMFSYNDKQND